MDLHLTTQQIEKYQRNMLSSEEREAVNEHLDTCPQCRARVGMAEPLSSSVASLLVGLMLGDERDTWHLSNDQAAAYVDGTLGSVDLEMVNGHLEVCSSCVAHVRELRELQTLLSTYPPAEPLSAPTFQTRLHSVRETLASYFTARTLIAACVAACIVFLIMRSLPKPGVSTARPPQNQANETLAKAEAQAKRIADLQQQLAQAQKQNALAAEQLAQRDVSVSQKVRENQALQAKNRELTALNSLRGHQPEPVKTVIASVVPGGKGLMEDAHGNPGLWVPVRLQDRLFFKEAMQEGKVNLVAYNALQTSASKTLGTSHLLTVNLASPVRTCVSSDSPAFKWHPVPGAQGYELTLSTQAGAFRKVDIVPQKTGKGWEATLYDTTDVPLRVVSGPVHALETEWTPPRAMLRPGTVYEWSVSAYSIPVDLRATETAKEAAKLASSPTARFRLLTQAQQTETKQAEIQYANSPLLLGLYYAAHGLRDDACNELRPYLQKDPANKAIQKLLNTLTSDR